MNVKQRPDVAPVYFWQLPQGTVFTNANNIAYMKTNRVDTDWEVFNTVMLENGELCYFDHDDMVYPHRNAEISIL